MANKVHPQTLINYPIHNKSKNKNSTTSYESEKRETFTIWMKSLVYHGYGCTVYNSNGDVVYRVDNYGNKGCNEVHLMDLHGKALFTLRRKMIQLFGHTWYGFKNSMGARKERAWFKARKVQRIVKRGSKSTCQVSLGLGLGSEIERYRIVKESGKTEFIIVDRDSNIVAEVKQKRSSSGVVLGEDVLTMEVTPKMDQSFVMALVTVYGLIHHKM